MAEHHDNDDRAPTVSASEAGIIAIRAYGGRRLRVLAHGGRGEKFLAHDERYVYWSDSDDATVTRLPKDGGIPLVLATEQHDARALTLAGGYLYWSMRPARERKPRDYSSYDPFRVEGQQSIVRMPVEGGDVEVLATDQERPTSIAVHQETLVWTTFGSGLETGAVWMKPLCGGPARRLASKQKQPYAIAIDTQQIYWTNQGIKRPTYFRDGSVMRIARGEEKKRFIIAKEQPLAHSITADSDWIYWSRAASHDEPTILGGIYKRPKSGSGFLPLTVWTNATSSPILALDATHVYWLWCFGAELFRMPKKGGGDPERLMAAEQERMLQVQSLVIDDRCIYFSTRDSPKAGGAIFKMAK